MAESELTKAVNRVIEALKNAEISAVEAFNRFDELTRQAREARMSDTEPKYYAFQFAGCRSGSLSLWSRIFTSLQQAVPEKNEADYTYYDMYFREDEGGPDPETRLSRLGILFIAQDDKEANKIRERLLNAFLKFTMKHTDVFFLRSPAGELYEYEPDSDAEHHQQRVVPPGMIILDSEE